VEDEMAEDAGMPRGNSEAEDRSPRIAPTRRRELMALADRLVSLVEVETKAHERCLLNTLVRAMLSRD